MNQEFKLSHTPIPGTFKMRICGVPVETQLVTNADGSTSVVVDMNQHDDYFTEVGEQIRQFRIEHKKRMKRKNTIKRMVNAGKNNQA